jgi:hypothetical protein
MEIPAFILSTVTVLSGSDPMLQLMKRPVRSRMQGVVGAGGEKLPATRFGLDVNFLS